MVTGLVSVANLTKKARPDVPEVGFVPDLEGYDWIVVSSSAGKDSHAMLDYVNELAKVAGAAERVVVVHSDLGEVEWDGTGELAAEHAAHYGNRFEVVTRIGGVATRNGKVYKKGETYGSILDYARRRGAWPDANNRWCTSDFKRGPIGKVFTKLAKEWKAANPGADRACRILDCMGLRAEESPARAKKDPFVVRVSNRNKHVDSWLPIHAWKETHVWDRIKASGVRYHPAYDLGMKRLSCALCIFAPKKALVLAGTHNRELLDRYVEVEEATGHKFRMDVSLAEVREAVRAGETFDEEEDDDGAWNM